MKAIHYFVNHSRFEEKNQLNKWVLFFYFMLLVLASTLFLAAIGVYDAFPYHTSQLNQNIAEEIKILSQDIRILSQDIKAVLQNKD